MRRKKNQKASQASQGRQGTWAVRGQVPGRPRAWRKPLGRQRSERIRAGAGGSGSRPPAGRWVGAAGAGALTAEEGRAGRGGGEGEDSVTASDLQ